MVRDRVLYRRAREAAGRRRHLLGEDPPTIVRHILATPGRSSFSRNIFLLYYVYLLGAIFRLRIFLSQLADHDTPASRRRILRLKKALLNRLSESCRISEAFLEREYFSRDVAVVPRGILRFLYRSTPLLVAQPDRVEDIKELFSFCSEHHIPITVRAASSSVFGAVIPTSNGIVLDLSGLNKVVGFDPVQRRITVEAGMRWVELDSFLEPYGLSFPLSPTSRFSTVGGWLATGGLGINSYRYGAITEQVENATLLHLDGSETMAGKDNETRKFWGSEGQFGVFTQVTLRLQERSDTSALSLLSFQRIDDAVDFVRRLSLTDCLVSHVVVYDCQRMLEENWLFSDRIGRTEMIIPERDAVLLCFDNQEQRDSCLQKMVSTVQFRIETDLSARYLYEERFFPLKSQRLGPNLLAVEVLLPDLYGAERVNSSLDKLLKLYGIKAALEIIVVKRQEQLGGVLILSFPADARRRFVYLLQLVCVQLAVFLAIRLGARPYGFGIWNAPFFRRVVATERRQELVNLKNSFDPKRLLNRGKFFSIRGRFYGATSLFFQQALFVPLLHLGLLISPFFGLVLRALKKNSFHRWEMADPAEDDGRKLLAEAIQRCTFCGACVSVCPAYQLTRDELATGRGKLFLAERLLSGRESRAGEHFRSFQCLHCHLCEEVCQTRLPLVLCYQKHEELTVKRFGPVPKALLSSFVELVDRKRDWLLRVFGIKLAQWSPTEMSPKYPGGRQDMSLNRASFHQPDRSGSLTGGRL